MDSPPPHKKPGKTADPSTANKDSRTRLFKNWDVSSPSLPQYLDRLHVCYFETDIEGQLTYCNDVMSALIDFKKHRGCQHRIASQPLNQFVQDAKQLSKKSHPQHYIAIEACELSTPDNRSRLFDMVLCPILNEQSKITGFCGTAWDVTQRAQNELRLQESNAELEAHSRDLEENIARSNSMAFEAEMTRLELHQIFNSSADGMWVVDRDFNIQKINQILMDALQISHDDAIGMKCYDLFQGSPCQGTQCPMNHIFEGQERIECDAERTDANQNQIPYILTATPFRDPAGEIIGIVESLKDITERKKVEIELQKAKKRLEHLATVDELTQLANRRRLDAYIDVEWKRAIRNQSPIVVIMCDIDFFKKYNDHYGHQAGDLCLHKVATAIKQNAKRPADLAARYGGEEFVVILPETDTAGAQHVAHQILESVQKLQIQHQKSPINDHVTLSIGLAGTIPEIKSTPAKLIQIADQALYQAKENGRNRIIAQTANSSR